MITSPVDHLKGKITFTKKLSLQQKTQILPKVQVDKWSLAIAHTLVT